ncbi:MAG: DNA primase [Desulfobulbus sp.]|nr:DNA primase [Desulfobulbus sp.]
MTRQPVVQEKQSRATVTRRLLLDRISKAAFDEAGRNFVARAFGSGVFWAECPPQECVELSVVAQQHGLFAEALTVFQWLNQNRPQFVQGWQAHVELLATLGRHTEAAQVKARAQRFVPADTAALWQADEPAPVQTGDERLLDPFIRLRQREEEVQTYMALFRGREEAFARQWADRNEEKQGYVPVQRQLLPEDVWDHIQGRKTYGIYLLNRSNQVWIGVIDVDLVPRLRDRQAVLAEKANIRRESVYLYTRLLEKATQAGLTCIPEISGGKGYHFWFPLKSAVPAADMRRGLQVLVGNLAADLRCFALEIFPKQDQLTGKGFGNLVKLPLGIHRGTGRKSSFIGPGGRTVAEQLRWLRKQEPAAPRHLLQLVKEHENAKIMLHPKQAAWAADHPELAELELHCSLLGQLMAMARAGKALSVREEKVLFSTIGHLRRGRLLLHSLFAKMPEYNRPLLDYKISRIRGTPLGCRRIHKILDQTDANDLPCQFDRGPYPHPLLHLKEHTEQLPIQEKAVSLKDALLALKTAIIQVERFL